ncbi:MAG: ATP-binding cassette domain-containing protein [Gammaproteobacteria bacterium]|nr:ATP-binding cassette domain-containing protein [Gammaproteobacteria bacterium]
MIEARGLCKRFGAIDAVREISFVAGDGRITGLLGPNGAGKSTCLRLIGGVLAPDRGEARIDGIDVGGEASAARARLGALPHAAGLYGHLTGRENIAYFGALHRIPAARIGREIDRWRERLGMADFLDRPAKSYSQGQRVKVALARALVHEPRNLVLDEPTNGLDVMAIRALRGVLAELRTEGRCILFSSHVMQEVSALCDRIVIIGGGRVLADDTPAALRVRSGTTTLEEAFLRILADGEREDEAPLGEGAA